MKKFENAWKYFVFLRGAGNPDFRQYTEIANNQIALVKTLEEAQDKCQEYICQWDLGGGNWTGSRPGDIYTAGNVFDLDGNLVKYISYNGKIWDIEQIREAGLILGQRSTVVQKFPNDWKVQFDSWNRWQINRLESLLQEVDAQNINRENWRGSDEPEFHTFCEIRDVTISQIIQIAKEASPYVHITHLDVKTRINLKTYIWELDA